jgi:pimeloyl-ACP methyl ester carboxylesterase
VLEVDVTAFEREVAEGTPASLAAAAQRYQGDLLAGLSVDSAGGFEEWLLGERERLRELALEALAKLLAQQRQAGRTESAIQTGRQLLSLDPVQEPAHRALMRLYAQAGRRGAALRQYQQCVEVLQRELGVEPEAETRQLYQEILQRRDEPARTPPTALRARGEPATAARAPLIGRETELATLRDAFAEAQGRRVTDKPGVGSGGSHVVLVVGQAGVGKTRLLEEFAADAEGQGARVLLGRAYESEQILPFGPWVDALRSGKVLAETSVLDALPAAWRAELARLFPEAGEPGLPISNAPEDYRRLFEAVAHLLGLVAAGRPLVLLLEDIHWADEMSLRLFSFLGRRMESGSLLLVGTARDEELPGALALRHFLEELGREGRLVRLALAPLSRTDTGALVRLLTRAGNEDAEVARLGEQVWTVSEGNPFMAVETMRAMREGTAPAAITEIPLPQRVRDLIAGRLDRLSERSRQLLAAAAVVGREFEFALLPRAVGLTDRDAAEAVEELVRRRILHGVGERFDFTHDRIRAVAYDQLLPPRRKLLHGAVAEALEALPGEVATRHRPSEFFELLAGHFERAEVWARAVHYYLYAAEKAAERYGNASAARLCSRALAISEPLPALGEERLRGLVLQGDLCSRMGDLEQANAAYGRALRTSSDPEVRQRIANKRHEPRVATRAGARIAFYEHGSGDHTLVLASPLLYGLATFQPVVERLCQEFRVVTIDPRGMGASDPLARPYTVSDHMEDVRAVIGAAGGGPVVGVGISRGSNLLIRLAVTYPSLVGRLVVVGTPLAGVGRRPMEKAQEFLRRGEIESAVRFFFSIVFSEPGLDALADQVVSHSLRLPRETILSFFDPDPQMDVGPLASRVPVPTLVVHGTDDRNVPVESAEHLASLIPGARLHRFEGRGHLPVFTATDEFCEALRRFAHTGT